ncbi:MAG TPA: HAMP domain-containing sensor histidine kinase [Ktedonobacterales bacterium]
MEEGSPNDVTETPSWAAGVVWLWRAALRWVAENTFRSEWLPESLQRPAAGFVVAVALEALAALLTLLLVFLMPFFSLFSIFSMLVVVLVALTWGAAPGLVATVTAAVTLEVVVLPYATHVSLWHFTNLIEVTGFVVAGGLISVFASGTERARRRAVTDSAESHTREVALRETNERADEFLSIASHELRSPLTSLKAALQLAQRRLSKLNDQSPTSEVVAQLDTVRGLLVTAEQQVDRQDRLVGDLLDVSRIRAGRLEFRHAICDLGSIVTDAVEEQRLSWPERTIILRAPQDPLPIDADAHRIGQVVTNLLTNALKYSMPDADVAVTVTVKGAVARVAVRDHGPGLTKQQQAHIWERFHRVANIRQLSGSGAGLGLGLHIARTIVEHHKGSVGVRSVPLRGSTFWFTLPLLTNATI